MKVTVIGNGAIGKERIKALNALNETIVAVIDKDDILTDKIIEESDWIFICTPHDVAPGYVKQIGKRAKILVEKPYLGEETDINVGFNYRFYQGVNELMFDIIYTSKHRFGKIISINMILALGDGPEARETWRLDPKQGRGALLDPGIHLIDLAMRISNRTLREISRKSWSGFWNTGIEEETHLLATDDNGIIYNIQASKVHWRSTFRIEVNGTDGYGILEGRNRAYGRQTYRRGVRWAWKHSKSQRDSEEIVLDYDGEDSFKNEIESLFNISGAVLFNGTGEDNQRCIKFINNDDNHAG